VDEPLKLSSFVLWQASAGAGLYLGNKKKEDASEITHLRTTIWSQWRTVDSLWATNTAERPYTGMVRMGMHCN